MDTLKNKPWFVFLLVLFFILHGTVENFGYIYFIEIIKVGGVILASVAVFFLVTKFIVKNVIYAALICFFISVWMLFFGAIFDWVKTVSFFSWLHSYTIFIPFMFFTIIVFVISIRRKITLQNKLAYYLNVLLLIYCLFDFGSLIFKLAQPQKSVAIKNVHFDTSLVREKPNVYFLLFDEYPGYKSLKDSFSFLNDDLYHHLQNNGFEFLPTFSNYNKTYYSMSSMLNMQYIDKPYDPLSNTFFNDQERINEIKKSKVIEYFTSLGYSFKNYSIFDILDQPAIKGNSFVVSQATLLTHKIFFHKLLNDIGWHFVTGKNKINFLEHFFLRDKRNNILFEKKVIESSKLSETQPKFAYAHFLMPHSPSMFDSVGNPLSNAQIFNFSLQYDKGLFLSYLKYVNKKIKIITDEISMNDPKAIIVVMSDHGWRHYQNEAANISLHFNNICAVHFPNKNYLPMKNEWSNVNFFRYLFNSQFNQKISYLADSSIFLVDKK